MRYRNRYTIVEVGREPPSTRRRYIVYTIYAVHTAGPCTAR